MSGYREHAAAVAVDRENAVRAATDHGRAADSVSDGAVRVCSAFDSACVPHRYADVGATLTAGVDAAAAALRQWGASSAAVADAVRVSIVASSDLDDSSATAFGDVRP